MFMKQMKWLLQLRAIVTLVALHYDARYQITLNSYAPSNTRQAQGCRPTDLRASQQVITNVQHRRKLHPQKLNL